MLDWSQQAAVYDIVRAIFKKGLFFFFSETIFSVPAS